MADTSSNMKHLTSNQRYRGLNNRFNKRAKLLHKFGFTYRQACPGVAVFARSWFTKETNLTAAEVMHSDNTTWIDTLALILRR